MELQSVFEGRRLVILDARPVIKQLEATIWKLHKMSPKAYSKRSQLISTVVFHQTAGGIKAGLEGVKNTASFFVRPDDPKTPGLEGRGWPGFAYTFYMPFEPELDEQGRYIGYQTQDEDVVSYHTGGAPNGYGVALAFQGNFRSKGAPNNGGDPSPAQMQVVDEWMQFFEGRYESPKFTGHWEHGKDTCPGWWLQNWICIYRGEEPLPEPKSKGLGAGSGAFATWLDVQQALHSLGYDLGKYGPNKNGVDGDWGYSSRVALEKFQRDHGLTVTGVLDLETEGLLAEKARV
jgi:hypothetical protein